MSVVITRAGVDDLPAIMPVMTSAFSPRFGEAWTESQCLGVLSMPGSELIIARDGDPIGFALSRTIIDECELMLLAVAPESQQHGVGRDLLNAMTANARAAGARSVFLEVRQGNPAISLYSSADFREVGRRRGYYRGPMGEIFDSLTYRLTLS
jgi:[ribosomal protein S18]-alanine N-acetyltransferase